MNTTFSINLYDQDGDKIKKGILLFLEENTIIVLKDISDLDNLIKDLVKIKKEIEHHYEQFK